MLTVFADHCRLFLINSWIVADCFVLLWVAVDVFWIVVHHCDFLHHFGSLWIVDCWGSLWVDVLVSTPYLGFKTSLCKIGIAANDILILISTQYTQATFYRSNSEKIMKIYLKIQKRILKQYYETSMCNFDETLSSILFCCIQISLNTLILILFSYLIIFIYIYIYIYII